MLKISILKDLLEKVPDLKLSCIECDVVIQNKNEILWNEIKKNITTIASQIEIKDISQLPAIAASRVAYKACGKDPARYRLSAEALLRRVVNRGEIYQVNNVVDVLNLVSIKTGFSIGGYDKAKISGNVTFGIGKKEESYEGIGRGELNIEVMPVFRDNLGAFGTPTSDSVRTSVTNDTQRFLMIIIDYAGTQELAPATEMAIQLLAKYTNATNFETYLINE